MLDLATAKSGQGVSHNRDVHTEQGESCFVAERLSQRCRIYNVGEQDSSNSRIARVGCRARQQNRSCVICVRAAKKSFCDVWQYLDDLFGQQSVRFAMD